MSQSIGMPLVARILVLLAAAVTALPLALLTWLE
jgi:hypothetical protein